MIETQFGKEMESQNESLHHQRCPTTVDETGEGVCDYPESIENGRVNGVMGDTKFPEYNDATSFHEARPRVVTEMYLIANGNIPRSKLV